MKRHLGLLLFVLVILSTGLLGCDSSEDDSVVGTYRLVQADGKDVPSAVPLGDQGFELRVEGGSLVLAENLTYRLHVDIKIVFKEDPSFFPQDESVEDDGMYLVIADTKLRLTPSRSFRDEHEGEIRSRSIDLDLGCCYGETLTFEK